MHKREKTKIKNQHIKHNENLQKFIYMLSVQRDLLDYINCHHFESTLVNNQLKLITETLKTHIRYTRNRWCNDVQYVIDAWSLFEQRNN